jgi:hypothetical protein
MGYSSDDSVEALMEERSRYSRYSVGESERDHYGIESDLEDEDDQVRERNHRDEDEDDGLADEDNATTDEDKYSRRTAASSTKKREESLVEGERGDGGSDGGRFAPIESLWSASTDDAPQWREEGTANDPRIKKKASQIGVSYSIEEKTTATATTATALVQDESADASSLYGGGHVVDPIYTRTAGMGINGSASATRTTQSSCLSSRGKKYDVSAQYATHKKQEENRRELQKMQKKARKEAKKKMKEMIVEAKKEEAAAMAAEMRQLELQERQQLKQDDAVPSSVDAVPKSTVVSATTDGSGENAKLDPSPAEFQRVVSDTSSLTDLHFGKRSSHHHLPALSAGSDAGGGSGVQPETSAAAAERATDDADPKKDKLSTRSSPANTILADQEVGATSGQQEEDKNKNAAGTSPSMATFLIKGLANWTTGGSKAASSSAPSAAPSPLFRVFNKAPPEVVPTSGGGSSASTTRHKNGPVASNDQRETPKLSPIMSIESDLKTQPQSPESDAAEPEKSSAKKKGLKTQSSEERSVAVVVASNEDEVELAWTPSVTAAVDPEKVSSAKKPLVSGRSPPSPLKIETTDSTVQSTNPSGDDESSLLKESSSADDEDEVSSDNEATDGEEVDEDSTSIMQYGSSSFDASANSVASSPVPAKDDRSDAKHVPKSKTRMHGLKGWATRVFRNSKPSKSIAEAAPADEASEKRKRKSSGEDLSSRQRMHSGSKPKTIPNEEKLRTMKHAESRVKKTSRSRSLEPVMKFSPTMKSKSDALPAQQKIRESVTSKARKSVKPSATKTESPSKKRAASRLKSPSLKKDVLPKPTPVSSKKLAVKKASKKASAEKAPAKAAPAKAAPASKASLKACKRKAGKKKAKTPSARSSQLSAGDKQAMYNKSLITEDSDESAPVESVAGGIDPPPPPVSPTDSMGRKKHVLRKEFVDVGLDEYIDPKAVKDEPQLAACLRYYYCGSAANAAGTAIKTVDCTPKSRAINNGGVDDVIMEQRMDDEEDRKRKLPLIRTEIREDDILRVGSSESLEDAPEIALPRTPSVAIEVTGMKLHLDDDSEAERRDVERLRSISKAESEIVSVTSIEFATSSSTAESPPSRYSADWVASASESYESDDEESILSLEEDRKSIHRRKKPTKGMLRGFLSRKGRNYKAEV